MSGCCACPLLVVESGVEEDGYWFSNGTGGFTGTSCADVVGFWVLVLIAFSCASTGDGVANVANMGGVMVSKRRWRCYV